MSNGRWPLPETWSWVRSADIAKIAGGGTPRADDERNFAEDGIKWITPADLTGYSDVYIGSGRRDLSERGLSSSGATLLPKGTVLFSSRAPVGYCAIAADEISTNQGFKSLVLEDEILPEYVRHYLLSAKEYAESLASGTTFLELSGKRMAELRIPLAPVSEQKRIVRKLDTLSARTTTAREHLTAIEKLVERYKAGVLGLAFAGDLTADWRARNLNSFVTIAEVRKQRRKDKKLSRRKRVAKLPAQELPNGWEWVSPDELANDQKYSIAIGPFGSNLVKSDYRQSGVRLVFVRDIRRGRFASEGAQFVDPEKAAELHQHIAGPGDVLITKMGDPPGDTCLFPEGESAAIITADCIKLRPHSNLSSSEYLNLCIRSRTVQAQIQEITKGVAQQKVSLDRFRQIGLPVAPLDEQREIVRQIETAFTKIDRLAAEAEKALKLTDRLDERILAKAFAGELVPQDPTDEPASVLLDRAREARANAPKKTRPRRTKATTMKKDPKELLLADSAKWPANGVVADGLAKKVGLAHDDLRDALFELLGGTKPQLEQIFDKTEKQMRLRRVAQ